MFYRFFEAFAQKTSDSIGTTTAFLVGLTATLLWGVTGPVFEFSENWQLIINTSTTIFTALTLPLILRSDKKDALAIHLKLDELLAASTGSNRIIDVEKLSEKQLKEIHERYLALAEAAKAEEESRD